MALTRRSALGLLALTGATTALSGYGRVRAKSQVGGQPLKIPHQLEGKMTDGAFHYDLTMGLKKTRFVQGVDTPTYGINGNYLGPTLRLKAGSKVKINVHNFIGSVSTLHWHGMHLPASADGGPHQMIKHGASWHPEFEVRQQASTLWYHAHQVHQTGFQVYHGLAGLIIVEDEQSTALDLPQDYGVDDIPLILQDRRFGSNGAFEYVSSMHDRMMGMSGDQLLVNGTLNAHFVAKSNRLRMRILNGSNARFYDLTFSDGRVFQHIASDGGLLERPNSVRAIRLAPAERAEIIVDLSDGKPVAMTSSTPSTGGMMGRMGRGMMGMFRGGNEDFKVLDILPDEGRRASAIVPGKLADIAPPNLEHIAKTRNFVLDMGMGMGMMRGGGGQMTINGKSMDMNRIDEVVRVGTKEIWQIQNPTPIAHPFHIHDVQFRILDRDGKTPGPSELGYKDTVIVNPGEQVRLLLEFADYTDPDRPYMYHCHILEHEDAGMMGQFTVVA